MKTAADYLEQLQNLLVAPTHGMSWAARASAARRLIDEAADGWPERAPMVRFVPFLPGRRPLFEARHPGLGSSDHAALLLRGEADTNRAYLLYEVKNVAGRADADRFRLDLTLFRGDPEGEEEPAPLPGWVAREVKPHVFEETGEQYDIVQAQRMDESTSFSFKQATASAFYKLINTISGTQMVSGAADFRGMSRQTVDALKSMPEYHRFLRGMVSAMGYKSVILPYNETKRIAGRTKYSLGKMFRLAMDAIFSFSLVPLYIGLSAGVLFFCLAATEMIYVYSFWFKGDTSTIAPGWSSLMFVILIASGVILIVLGFIGVYVGYIFQQVKQRPVYHLKKRAE